MISLIYFSVFNKNKHMNKFKIYFKNKKIKIVPFFENNSNSKNIKTQLLMNLMMKKLLIEN
jgi:hypothetical protein